MEYLDLGHVIFRRKDLIKASINGRSQSVMVVDFKDNLLSPKPEDKTLIVSDLTGIIHNVTARYCRKHDFLPKYEQEFKQIVSKKLAKS